jgi:hypothetical protein
MGFLDHSTNNIIIDAVLTDIGREFLSTNNADFNIEYFSLGDDEVDYTLIEKFGRNVGKEKISKNTPIFEAQTAASLALKHRLLTLPDPTILVLPTMSLEATEGLSGNTVSFQKTEAETRSVTLKQTVEGANTVPDGVSDQTFTLLVPDRFLRVDGLTPLQIEPNTRIATYSVEKSSTTEKNGAVVNFVVKMQQGLDNTTFNTFGDSNLAIKSVISVVGDSSGIRKDFQVSITK